MHRRAFGEVLMWGAISQLLACGDQITVGQVKSAEPPGSINVKRFGAVGDGLVDDTLALERALSEAAYGNGSVFMPAGAYRVTRTLLVESGVTLEGEGASSVITAIDGPLIVLNSSSTTGTSMRDFAIVGRFAHGILFEHATDAHVVGCHFRGASIPRFGWASGVFIVNSERVTIERCRFEGNGADDTFATSDILTDGLGHRSHDIHILNNECLSTNVAVNISAHDLSQSEIRGNLVRGARIRGEHNQGYGIMIYPTSLNLRASFENVIAENYIAQTDGVGIYLVRSSRSTIENNVIDDTARVQRDDIEAVGAITLNYCDSMTVRNNTISRSGRAGISVASFEAAIGSIEIRENTVAHTAGFGIQLRGFLESIKITGNMVSNTNGGIGSYNYDAQDAIEIRRNTIRHITKNAGIWLANAAQSHVEDNVIGDCATYALDLTFRDDVSSVTDNIVENATQAGSTSNAVRITRLGA
jgi:parallel beta-helix repeat protein